MKRSLLILMFTLLLCLVLTACGEAAEPTVEAAPTTVATEAETIPVISDIPSGQAASGSMVWIPTKGGIKYHSNAECSNMIEPVYVSVTEAALKGFTPCSKCH